MDYPCFDCPSYGDVCQGTTSCFKFRLYESQQAICAPKYTTKTVHLAEAFDIPTNKQENN